MAVSISFTDESQATAADPLTFSAQAIGVAAADRIICTVIGHEDADTVVSVTIGGITANQLLSASESNRRIWFYAAKVPTGTTADVVIDFTGNAGAVSLGVWRLIGADLTPFDSDSVANTVADTSVAISTVTIPTGGAGIFAMTLDEDVDIAWANATERYWHDLGVSTSAGGADTATPGTPTVTASWSGNEVGILAGVSFMPEPTFFKSIHDDILKAHLVRDMASMD